ncbi:MAG: hypothetical protein H6719_07070 [Sandaracinaceae bacterium]|nr:hypothetical protein [Sandaracinaceae bacterium]
MTLIRSVYWGGAPFDFRQTPKGTVEPVKLRTADFRDVRGLLWSPPSPKRGALLMHPRVDFTRHYAIPRLVDRGYAVLALCSRNPNDDTDTVHEELVLDVAAGVTRLREVVDRVALFGNSGGGSLMALYAAQAAKAPEARIARTPAGAPTALPRVALPPADALVLIAAHRGEGHVLTRCIDPSVIDETDPSPTDASVDMYATENGFAEPPAATSFDAGFVTRYRAAQADRVARIDARARSLVAQQVAAMKAMKDPSFGARPFAERQAIERARHAQHVMVVYRTMANLDYVDLSLDPSPRGYGSLLSERPDLMNRSLPGFARTVTPRAWLSTWSGPSSNADLTQTLPDVPLPVLSVNAGRDLEITPMADHAPIAEALAGRGTIETIEGAGHYFEAPPGADTSPHVEALMDVVLPWLDARG